MYYKWVGIAKMLKLIQMVDFRYDDRSVLAAESIEGRSRKDDFKRGRTQMELVSFHMPASLVLGLGIWRGNANGKHGELDLS